jgi:hypothetical protein
MNPNDSSFPLPLYYNWSWCWGGFLCCLGTKICFTYCHKIFFHQLLSGQTLSVSPKKGLKPTRVMGLNPKQLYHYVVLRTIGWILVGHLKKYINKHCVLHPSVSTLRLSLCAKRTNGSTSFLPPCDLKDSILTDWVLLPFSGSSLWQRNSNFSNPKFSVIF